MVDVHYTIRPSEKNPGPKVDRTGLEIWKFSGDFVLSHPRPALQIEANSEVCVHERNLFVAQTAFRFKYSSGIERLNATNFLKFKCIDDCNRNILRGRFA